MKSKIFTGLYFFIRRASQFRSTRNSKITAISMHSHFFLIRPVEFIIEW